MKNQIINNDLKIFTKKFNKFFKTKLGKDKNLLNKAMLYSINSGGKRFRPSLLYTFGKELNLSHNLIFFLSESLNALLERIWYDLVNRAQPARIAVYSLYL